jgi:hypothetical protein
MSALHIFEPLENYIVLVAYQNPQDKIFYFLKTYHKLASLCLQNKARTSINLQITNAINEYLGDDYKISVRQDFREQINADKKEYGFYLAIIENYIDINNSTKFKWMTFKQLSTTLPHNSIRLRYLKVLQILSESHKESIKVIENLKK